MSEDKRPASAIYAGLDEDKEMLEHGGSDAGKGEGAARSEEGASNMSADAAPASGSDAACDAGSVSRGAPSSSRPPKGSGLGAGQKAIIAIIAIVSVAVIAVSAFALAGGFAPEEAASTSTQVSVVSESDEAPDDAAEEEAQDDSSAADDAAGDGSASDSSSAATMPESSSSGSSASTSAPSELIQQEPSVPATITVAVSVDSSAVGSPVSLVTNVTLNQGATVYDALVATGLSVNAHSSQFGMYVVGIGGLAEKEHGGTSGWTYYHNGVFINNAASGTVLSDGDAVSWVYVAG